MQLRITASMKGMFKHTEVKLSSSSTQYEIRAVTKIWRDQKWYQMAFANDKALLEREDNFNQPA